MSQISSVSKNTQSVSRSLTPDSVIARYVDELVSRCALIIALYGQPHASDCAVSEHRSIIDALRKRNGAEAARLMAHHLGAVEGPALLALPSRRPDIGDILGRYAPRRTRSATGVKAASKVPGAGEGRQRRQGRR
jgi:hypothetical protein